MRDIAASRSECGQSVEMARVLAKRGYPEGIIDRRARNLLRAAQTESFRAVDVSIDENQNSIRSPCRAETESFQYVRSF